MFGVASCESGDVSEWFVQLLNVGHVDPTVR